MYSDRRETHIMSSFGHVHDVRCWCEPRYYYMRDNDGNRVLVVEHNDEVLEPHDAVLAKRGQERDWITILLEGIQ